MHKNFKKLTQIFIVSISIFFFSYWILKIFFFNINWEFLYFFKKAISEKVSKEIIVVEIDDLTYNKLGYPFNRKNYIPFLDNISKAKPAVIAFDILFLDKWTDSTEDRDLVDKFKELWNIIIWLDIKNWNDGILPYWPFYNVIENIGYFKPTINTNTNKVYSIKPISELTPIRDWIVRWKPRLFESFSFAVVRSYNDYIYWKKSTITDKNIDDEYYEFLNKKVPVKDWEFFINYTNNKNFHKESFYNVYKWTFDKNLFKDKIVLIWFTAEWVKDDFYVPGYSKEWIFKWVYIHANAINNLLVDNYIIYFNEKIEYLIWFLFIFLLVYFNVFHLSLNLRWLSYWAIFLFVAINSIYYIVFILLYNINWIFLLPNFPFEFLSILIFSFFASSLLKYVNEDRNKRLLSKALSEYVSADIVWEVLNSTWNINLSWENKKITMFFSDIKWFTTISENMSPEELLKFLRVYLSDMSNIIIDNKWFINKYEWDAIMALWWVFWQIDNFWAIEACISALEQQHAIKVLNEVFEKKLWQKIEVRMWINTWNAIIWNIWAKWKKMEFTALWDNVNLASRLEWVNKFYWTNICVSEAVYDLAKEIFTFRYLDNIKVKWKNKSINIYELMWYNWKVDNLKLQIISEFERAISFYSKKEFKKALEIFENLKILWDKPSQVYIDKCIKYIENPPLENSDMSTIMDEK